MIDTDFEIQSRNFLKSKNSMTEQIQQVYDFQVTYNQPIAFMPQIPSLDRCTLRQKLLQEEVTELEDAWMNGDLVEVADAITDCLYILFGTAIEFGLQNKLVECFNEVQRSNMSKLDNEGNPIFRADGKIMKGENYSPPNLAKIISAT